MRGTIWVRAALAATTLAAAVGALAPAPAGAVTGSAVGDVVVDEAGGRVFATEGNSVGVYDSAGQRQATITKQFGAVDLLIEDGTLYVAAQSVSRINAIDLDDLSQDASWSLAATPVPHALAWAEGALWFTYGDDSWGGGIGRVDPATGVVTSAVTGLYGGEDLAGHPDEPLLYTLDRGLSPSKVRSWAITGTTVAAVATSPHIGACANGSELALSADGTKVWTACGAPYQFNEFDASTLGAPAVGYPAEPYPVAVARSGDGRFLVGGTWSPYDPDVFVYAVDEPVALLQLEVGASRLANGMLAVAADGGRVYAASEDGVLHTWVLEPQVTSLAPASVREGTAVTATVTGTELAQVETATVGGQEVAFEVVDDQTIELAIPADLPVGAHPVVLTGFYGTSEVGPASTFTVLPRLPAAPATPTVTGTPPHGISVTWDAPADHGTPITSYRVTARLASTGAVATTQTTSATAHTVTGLLAETSYLVSVEAVSAAGTGPASPAVTATAGTPPIGPFTTLSAFLQRQHQDVVGRPPTAGAAASWLAALRSGSLTPAGLVVALRGGSDAVTRVDPAARLYRAFFLRNPDAAGLRYWVGQLRAGRSLRWAADAFASSAEFRARYASLTNGQFVDLVYQNVLGRAPDASGRAFWTAQLDQGRRTRGQVMLGFSESAENKAAQAHAVTASVLPIQLLGRAPTAQEHADVVADLAGGTTVAEVVAGILGSAEYAQHVTG